jgi:hypothetical protein
MDRRSFLSGVVTATGIAMVPVVGVAHSKNNATESWLIDPIPESNRLTLEALAQAAFDAEWKAVSHLVATITTPFECPDGENLSDDPRLQRCEFWDLRQLSAVAARMGRNKRYRIEQAAKRRNDLVYCTNWSVTLIQRQNGTFQLSESGFVCSQPASRALARHILNM